MTNEENPELTPAQYNEKLKEAERLVKKASKLLQRVDLIGVTKYHTTLRNLNLMKADIQNEMVDLYKDFPELKMGTRKKLWESFEQIAKDAASVKRQ